LFGALSGEEQGLLGAYHLLDWVKEQGYTVGAMLDNDIVERIRHPAARTAYASFLETEKSKIATRPRANWRERLKRSLGAPQFE